MKRFFVLAVSCIMSLSMMAQGYHYNTPSRVGSTTVRPVSHRDSYDRHHGWGGYSMDNSAYFGIRMGMAISNVNSDDKYLDGSKSKVGLNLGVVGGVRLTYDAPLYLEGGLYYVEKGGKSCSSYKSFGLNYLQVPITLKYAVNVGENMSVQPLFGGYLACGVGGKVKDYDNRVVFDSFSENYFQRFDGGLRLGCGFQYELLYLELNYDFGLSNICHDYFDSSKNGSLNLTLGVNF